MKEIQGKIRIGVIDLFLDKSRFANKPHCAHIGVKKTFYYEGSVWDNCKLFSDMTEEQCTELVEGCEDGFGNYLNAQLKWFDSAKESLVSLLKANDCWIKEWVIKVMELPNDYAKIPDDFLIIKL